MPTGQETEQVRGHKASLNACANDNTGLDILTGQSQFHMEAHF